jgi:hypothetical protein
LEAPIIWIKICGWNKILRECSFTMKIAITPLPNAMNISTTIDVSTAPWE